MVRISLNEAIIDSIIGTHKVSNDSIIWKPKDNNLNFITADLTIKNNFKVDLKIIVTLNVEDYSKCSCVLLLNNVRVRGLCINGNHTNKCKDSNEWKGQTHKHKWTDKCKEGWAYTPTDIDESAIERAIYCFLKECNIDYNGEIAKPPPMQSMLEII